MIARILLLVSLVSVAVPIAPNNDRIHESRISNRYIDVDYLLLSSTGAAHVQLPPWFMRLHNTAETKVKAPLMGQG